VTEYELVLRAENTLGWTAPAGMALWKARRNEVAKLKKAMTKAGVSIDDVAVALELARREHYKITSPAALVWKVEEARERAAAPVVVSDIAQQIQDAIDFEMDAQLPGWEQWVTRLSRCSGYARSDVFTEWSTKRLAEAA
jgi:hypothetical protein